MNKEIKKLPPNRKRSNAKKWMIKLKLYFKKIETETRKKLKILIQLNKWKLN